YPAKDLQSYGLDKLTAVLTLRVNEDKEKQTVYVLQIGKAVDAKEPGGERFARLAKSDAVVVLPASLAKQLTAPPLQFRDRDLARFPGADRVALEQGKRRVVSAREEGDWKLPAPVRAAAERVALDALVRDVGKLRADELVPDKPAALKPFGLNP